MTEYEALVLACLNDPDDDGPRLILADWLDEQGKPHLLRYPGCWRLGYFGEPGRGRQHLAWRPDGFTEYAYSQTVLGPTDPHVPQITCANHSEWHSPLAGVRHEGQWLCWPCRQGWSPVVHDPIDRLQQANRRMTNSQNRQVELAERVVRHLGVTRNEFREAEKHHRTITDARAQEARHHPL